MQIAINIFLVLHFIGLAALFGGWFTQFTAKEKSVNAAMFHGSLTQVVTGIALVGLNEANAAEGVEAVNNTAVGIKSAALLVILILVLLNRKKPAVPVAVWAAIGGLTLLNVIVAVFVGPTTG
ncbi:MAG TPA: hypothetical protein DHW34_02730 [Actinobacteria bacterium]|jgi:hypothetical protein|nr:hypothetical protein [Actinomycetota bacterium]